MNIIIWLGLILASAILYRLGGQQGFNTKFRDIGVPLITTIALLKLGICHWVLILHFGLLFGALTTYWDDLFNGEDNFFMHGFMIGLACLDSTEAKMLLDFACDKNQGLSASRKPREKYGVGGPLGNIKYKFGDNEFPDKIFL